MGKHCLQSSLELVRREVPKGCADDLGKLAAVPRYQCLPTLLVDSPERSFFIAVHETINKLGRAIQLGQHRRLIDHLSDSLDHETLSTMTSLAWTNSEFCAALAVYLTTLEQAYHWPGDASVTTPIMLENHKLVIQMLNQSQLREMLNKSLELATSSHTSLISPKKITKTALRLARSILEVARIAQDKKIPLPRDIQDTVNLLYRTCRSDWGDQGDYNDHFSHREFGRLHEVIRASGTQRRMQDLFEMSGGLAALQVMPDLIKNLPSTSDMLSDVLTQLQYAVALVREELFTVSIDEVIWGRVFANFSKAVGFSDISAGGGDAPIFWMLDSLCGQADPEQHAVLPEELNFRARFFPPNIRDLFNRMQGLPTLRAYCNSPLATERLRQSFKALDRQRFELYEMHRKKAARILLSLRAGQRGSSANTTGCPYATPEKHLAKTLNTAMAARFGMAGDDLSIDAKAQAHSLMFDEHKNIHAARVRIEFGTPLVVGPGDCLLLSVLLPNGIWHTRTYSVTYTYATCQPLEHDTHQVAGAAEIYVRSKGLVSTYLCSQTQGCKVRVAIKPASHFRLVANSNTTDTTVFVAQGGALGVFLAWLKAQKRPIGRYVLIVGTRRYSQLGFKDEFFEVAQQLNRYLRIVVVLSKPDEDDFSLLQLKGIDVYHGRINQYLSHNRFGSAKSFYVCGSSLFGLDVAKSISLNQNDSKYPNRLEPIITSRLPPIRLHVAPEAPVEQQLPIISSSELAQHNSPTDLWIAVGNKVYDVTSLSKFHPGGEKILMARAGRQAQDLFESIHGGSVDIESMLENMVIGQLVSATTSPSLCEERLDKVVEIQNDVTNHSRFEKLPSSSAEELSETPPTHVIYASVECFGRDWCTLLQEMETTPMKQCHLMRAWLGLKRKLDAHQAAIYDETFGDIEQCRQAVQKVFDSLRTVSGEIHAALDDVKAEIAMCISNDLIPSCTIFEVCTDRIIQAINDESEIVAAY